MGKVKDEIPCWRGGGCPFDDALNEAVIVTLESGAAVISGDTTGAAAATLPTLGGCGVDGSGSRTAWFEIKPRSARNYTITT